MAILGEGWGGSKGLVNVSALSSLMTICSNSLHSNSHIQEFFYLHSISFPDCPTDFLITPIGSR